MKSDVEPELALGLGAEDAPSEVVVLRVDVALDTMGEEKGAVADDVTSSKDEDSTKIDEGELEG